MSGYELRWYQAETIKRLKENYANNINSNLAVLATGLGKCHTKGTKVLMYDGTFKKVENLEVGDQLMGPNSKPRNILNLGTGKEQCYRIIPTKGEPWECNESHILSLKCNDKRKKNYNKTINISVKEYLKQHKTFKHTHKLYKSEGLDFKEKNVPLNSYYLGLWLGDGTKRSPDITNIDKEVINWLKKYSKKLQLKLKKKKYKNRCPVYAFVDKNSSWTTQHKITEKLLNLNLINNKHIPYLYKTSSREQRLQVLAGLIDSDGSLHDGGVNYEITQKREVLSDDIVFLARSLGFWCEKKEKVVNGVTYYRMNIIGDTDEIPVKIERKKSNPRKQKKNHLRTGFEVKPIGKKKYYGFQLDGDHLYLLKDFTVTHNTVLATEFHKEFKPKERTLFLVDRIELAYQARDSFMKSDPSLNIGIEMNTHHASEDDDVVIACIHTIGRKGSYRIGKFDPSHFTKIICDEAHLSVSDIYTRVLNYLEVGPDNFNPEKILVGLTATPNRTDGVSLGHVYDEIVVNYDIRFGIKEGYLTDISLIRVDTEVDLTDEDLYTPTDFDTKKLDEKINIATRNTQIVKSYLEFSRGEPCIVYSNSVDHAYELKEIFEKNGVRSEVIEAETKKSDRKRYIADYKKGYIKVLINYATLTLGFNAPETSTIIIGRPIRSELLLRQIVGRGIRPSRFSFVDHIKTAEGRRKAIQNSAKAYCKVIDIHDTVGDHDIVSVPSLFGLNPELKPKKEQQRFFEEVVEPLEDIRRERQINIREIEDLENIDLIVDKKKLNVSSLKTPSNIQKHSDRDWVKAGEDSYEIVYPDDNKSMVVQKNALDKYEVFVQSKNSDNAKKLNEFFDLSGAIKLADDYADKNFDTQWVEEADWKKKGVTKAQKRLLKKMYRGRIGESYGHYEDTGVTKLYDRQLKEQIENAGHASKLIKQKNK